MNQENFVPGWDYYESSATYFDPRLPVPYFANIEKIFSPCSDFPDRNNLEHNKPLNGILSESKLCNIQEEFKQNFASLTLKTPEYENKYKNQSNLAKIALHQVEVLNHILEKRLKQKQTDQEHKIVDQSPKGSVYEDYVKNIALLETDSLPLATLPPSLRLDVNTKAELYRYIAQCYTQRKELMKNGYTLSEEICSFCKNNNEPEFIYRSHRLKCQGYTSCPILRLYTCPLCNAFGDNAHTIKYCPAYSKGAGSC